VLFDNFCETVRALRGKVSQEEMARRVGVTRLTWRAWETGLNKPTCDSLKKIAETLGVSIDALTQ
jgi:transcriptional regulator with XRE-family HTH domain